MASSAVDFARSNQQRFLNELKDLLRIPSVSTLEEHKPDIQKAADFVANELRRIGMENVEIIPTKGPSAHLRRLAARLRQADRPVLRTLRRAARRAARRMAHSAFRAHRAQQQHLCPRRSRRQRPALDGSESPRIPHARRRRQAAHQREGDLRRRRRSRRRIDRRIHPQAESQAESRFRAGLRHRTVRAESSDALRRPARPGLYRNRSSGREDRFAFRHVRRRGAESVLRSDRNHQQTEGLQRQDSDSRLLQGRQGSEQGRTQSLEASALQRGALPQDRSRIQSPHGRARLLRALSHLGAAYARSPRYARRLHRRRREDRNSGARRRPKSPCAWCPTRMPTTS